MTCCAGRVGSGTEGDLGSTAAALLSVLDALLTGASPVDACGAALALWLLTLFELLLFSTCNSSRIESTGAESASPPGLDDSSRRENITPRQREYRSIIALMEAGFLINLRPPSAGSSMDGWMDGSLQEVTAVSAACLLASCCCLLLPAAWRPSNVPSRGERERERERERLRTAAPAAYRNPHAVYRILCIRYAAPGVP